MFIVELNRHFYPCDLLEDGTPQIALEGIDKVVFALKEDPVQVEYFQSAPLEAGWHPNALKSANTYDIDKISAHRREFYLRAIKMAKEMGAEYVCIARARLPHFTHKDNKTDVIMFSAILDLYHSR